MCGLRAIWWRGRDSRASCNATANRAAAPDCKTKPYDANHARFRHTNNHAGCRAAGNAKPGPNRQPGCDSLRRAARQD